MAGLPIVVLTKADRRIHADRPLNGLVRIPLICWLVGLWCGRRRQTPAFAMRPFVELPDFGIRQSGFRVQGHVPREWHLVIPNFGSQFGQYLHLPIGCVITPAGKIHMTSGLRDIILYEPRQSGQVTIPGPCSALGVTILTGALENSSELRCRLRACKQWLIGTLSLDSPKWMNKGGGDAQQTYGGYTCFE